MSNYLKKETSLYLNNSLNSLVNWYSWNPESLQKAQQEEKPIFLSIGYSGSYWCEVMQEESFHNETVADMLNQHFIPIKVDKDERADIDKYYKQVYQLMNGQACASPVSIFLTENLEPFYSAAYIAPYPKGNVLGFEELLKVVIDKYAHDKATMIKKGQEVRSYLNPKKLKIEATRLNLSMLYTVQLHAKELFDPEYGGFRAEPKFLHISTLELLLDTYDATQDKELLTMVEKTLQYLYEAEIYDAKQGGFYRYANQKDWSFPRQEKTTYDNALIASLYWRIFQLTQNIFYKSVAQQVVNFMLIDMLEADLFYSNSVVKKNGELIIDKKIVTAYNAMMITTLFEMGKTEDQYTQQAIASLDQLLEQAYPHDQLFHTDNIKGFLEDYAYLGLALLTAYRTTQNQRYLILAETLANQSIEQFYDYGFWKFSNDSIVVYDDIYDPLYPSAMATMLLFLHQLSFFMDSDYNQMVFRTLEINSYQLMRQPISSPKMSQVLVRHLKKML